MSGTKRKLAPSDRLHERHGRIRYAKKSQMAEAYVQYAPKMVCRQ